MLSRIILNLFHQVSLNLMGFFGGHLAARSLLELFLPPFTALIPQTIWLGLFLSSSSLPSLFIWLETLKATCLLTDKVLC